MGKRTGNPRGRPRKAETGKPAVGTLRPKVDFGLTDEQIAALVPLDVLALCARTAVKIGDLDRAADVAEKWARYVHAKPTAPMELTADDLRRIIDAARTEAGARAVDQSATAGSAGPHRPN